MQLENPLTFVRSLKGAPASVLWAFFFTRRVMTALELEEWTGYKGDNMTVALRLLVNLGWLIARTPRGPWCLAEGRQMPLMDMGNFQIDSTAKDESDLIGFNSSSSSSKYKVSTIEEDQDESDDSDLIGVVAENKVALDEAGIREPKRSKLAQLEHVTPEFIRGHVEQARREGNEIGTAIFRIEHNWSISIAEKDSSSSTPGGSKYQGGLYADLLNHDDDEEHPDDCTCLHCKRVHPERFCQFRVVHPAERTSRSKHNSEWVSICDRLLEPGQKYCDEHSHVENEEP